MTNNLEGSPEPASQQTAEQTWKELFRRGIALVYAAAYTHTHQSSRDASLRMAYLGYRFMRGDDVTAINRDADRDNESRITGLHHLHAPQNYRVPKWVIRILERK